MKFIFDFDDVLFFTTKRRKEYLYPFLEKKGISSKDLDDYYAKNRGRCFSMKNLLAYFSLTGKFYEEVMSGSEDYVNKELVEIIKKIGKNNCFIVTYGDEEFQLDKIKRTGIDSLVFEIIVIPIDDKEKIVEKICAKYKNEEVVFIDDKIKHFKNLNLKKFPNLKTILYDEKGLEKVKAILSLS